MSDTIIFDLKYTPYKPPKNATTKERAKHAEERAFYDLSGGKNVLDYISQEGKRVGKFTALEYLQKSTGVFNENGMIAKDELEEMKVRLSQNKGHIHHGFISLSERDSPRIDTPKNVLILLRKHFLAFSKKVDSIARIWTLCVHCI